MTRKRLIIGAISLVIILAITVLILSLHKSPSVSVEVINNTSDSSNTNKVIISNISIAHLTRDDQNTIEQGIFYNINQAGGQSNSYDGIIRAGSYQNSTLKDGSNQISFLVDIASVKQSYSVSLTNNPADGSHILYILCPTSSQLVYPAFACKDATDE